MRDFPSTASASRPGEATGGAWYRQPWMWLVVGLPLASVLASLSMVVISIQHRDDLVRDDWYKAGRAINQDLHAARQARALGLGGVLTLDPAALTVAVEIAAPSTLADASLKLVLIHSTLAEEDMTTLLSRGTDGHWRGVLPQLPLGKRHLTLEPQAASATTPRWRLRADNVVFQGLPVTLAP